MTEASDWIINTTDGSFEADVMERSEQGLVVVDFWAEWCAPCRVLGPVLEQLAQEGEGRFTLVKADTEQTPQAATQFGVSGIPAVFAVLDRQIVDGFQGALSETEVRGWLERLEATTAFSEAKRLRRQDPAAAEQRFREILEQAPDHEQAMIALAELLLEQDRQEECREMIGKLEARGFLEPEAEKVKAALDLKGKTEINLEAARAAAGERPDDFASQLALAEALVGQQRYAEAFDICLSLVEQDRHGTGEQARELMVEVFRALPDDSELTSEYRRKLSMLLF